MRGCKYSSKSCLYLTQIYFDKSIIIIYILEMSGHISWGIVYIQHLSVGVKSYLHTEKYTSVWENCEKLWQTLIVKTNKNFFSCPSALIRYSVSMCWPVPRTTFICAEQQHWNTTKTMFFHKMHAVLFLTIRGPNVAQLKV